MRRLVPFAVASAFASLAILAACVGSDPNPDDASPEGGASSSGTTSSGGSSGATSSSGGSSSGGSSSGGSSGSADAGDGGDGSVPYTPKSLPGLKLWLESTKELNAGSSGGTPLGQWLDQSGAWDGGAGEPDGGRHVAYPDGVNTPTIEANGINGRPTVFVSSGAGSWMRIATHEDFQFGVGDWMIVEVAKVSAGTGRLWSLGPPGSAGYAEAFAPGQLCVSYGQFEMKGCTMPVYAASTSEPHVFVARRKGDVFTLRVDGVDRGSVDRAGEVTNIFISEFARPNLFIGDGLDALISEVIVVVGPTSDAKLTELEAHLKTKYATP